MSSTPMTSGDPVVLTYVNVRHVDIMMITESKLYNMRRGAGTTWMLGAQAIVSKLSGISTRM